MIVLIAIASMACVGPMGRLGLEPEVVDLLTKDTAAWCVTVDMGNVVFLTVVRVTYWRDNAPERGMSNMRDCVTQ